MNEYTNAEMIYKYQNLDKDTKIKILFDAIRIMQQDYLRGRYECIFMVMGYKIDKNYKWRKGEKL